MEQKVYIVDDDEAVRDSAAFLVKSVGLQAEVFESGQAFLDCDKPKQGCIVLDVRMPGIGGLELQKLLADRGSELPIIFVTGHADVPMAVEAMKYGAADFIPKPYRDQELLDCINKALASNQEKAKEGEEKQQIVSRMSALTNRESEVLQAVVAGKANKVIADELCVSQRTVEVYRAKVMEKMGADSLAELVQMVLKASN